MAVIQQQATKQGFRFHFFRSTYITTFTEWLLGFGGKSAHVILIFTTLYMSAQLFVKCPPQLSMAVFIVQMFALDMGGVGLKSLGRQAIRDGNTEGGEKAAKLGQWLINIMIAGIITVSLNQVIDSIPHSTSAQSYIDAIKLIIELTLTVGRAICAVMYGSVVASITEDNDHVPQQPTITPAPALDYNQIARAIAPLMAPQLNGLRATIIAEIRPLIVAPEPLNYQQLAQQIAPLVAPGTAPEPLDYRAIARAIAPLLPEPEPVQTLDYGAIAQFIAPLLKPQFLEARRFIIEEVKAIVPQLAAPAAALQIEAGATDQSQDTEPGETAEQRDTRLEAAYQELRRATGGKRVSGRQLADRAKANRTYCTKWLQEWHPENEAGATRNGTGATDQNQDTEPVPAYVVDSGVLTRATH
jgi:hypothetical protein